MNWNELWWCLACQRFPVRRLPHLYQGVLARWAGQVTNGLAEEFFYTLLPPLQRKSNKDRSATFQKSWVKGGTESKKVGVFQHYLQPSEGAASIRSRNRVSRQVGLRVCEACDIDMCHLHSFYSTIFSHSSPPHATLYVLHESVSVLPGYIWTWLQQL